ncbi:MAG: ComF family protein [bacterium]|nr:MAG: ComF family protein [bacterium]
MIVQNVVRGFLDALYPPFCLICGRLSDGPYPHCCPDCFRSFEPIGTSCCELCGEPFQDGQVPHVCLSCIRRPPPFDWCRGVLLYRGALAEALSRLKYSGALPLLQPLVEALLSNLGASGPLPVVDAIVPVPLSLKGLWKRGFNQSVLLATPVARHLKVKVQEGTLRKRGGKPQVGIAASQRHRNAMSSFLPGPSIDQVKGKRLLLFDDVFTTGATARACAGILRAEGAKVSVLTLARAGKASV